MEMTDDTAKARQYSTVNGFILPERYGAFLDGRLSLRQELDQARAERDEAVGAVHELITAGRDAYDNGYPEMERAVCEARAALARLPHASERAQAQRDVIAAARDAMAQIHDQRTLWPAEVDTLDDKLARLDALESGGGE